MADDGMLLNFSVGDAPLKSKAKFKGGNWKDRLVAKKLSARRHAGTGAGAGTVRPHLPLSGPNQQRLPPRKSRTNAYDGDADFPQPAQKRRRHEGGFRPSGDFVPSSQTKALDARPTGANNAQLGDREVISSLFSFNPQAKTAPAEGENVDSEPAKPSNAPLIDGLDTFTTLGLSQRLAAHLLTKMELKDPTAIQKAAVTQLVKEDADAFIQSETGSGKTLAYLLPLVQRIMNLSSTEGSSTGNLHRDSGLFAIILAPTRELCKQISVVLERLLGCAHYIVAGTVMGGEGKKSEKARLRKGLNILVATPGRLADHLDNTEVLDISRVRWLVLDEGDRLMDLGFEDEIQKIVSKLDERQKEAPKIKGLPKKRSTILCSATMKMNVQRLGEISLKDATLIKGEGSSDESSETKGTAFLAPAQLQQSYMVVAAKLRLVTLIALLKRTFARKGSVMKAIVFVSCADSVDFHFDILSQKGSPLFDEAEAETAAKETEDTSQAAAAISKAPLLSSPTNPLNLYKLHGSLPQSTRTQIVNTFSKSTEPSLLISTDVASRGLDLPNLDLVIEYDPAFSADDHLHRIGRTARLGRDGRAIIFLLPGEEEGYVEVLRQSYRDAEGARALTHTSAEEVLKRGFAPPIQSQTSTTTPPTTTTKQTPNNKKKNPATSTPAAAATWEETATTLQLNLERLILLPTNSSLLQQSRKAYQSHIRAYATHTATERKYFNIKNLHLGHLAKAFALRDKPSGIGIPGRNAKDTKTTTVSANNSSNSRKRTASGTAPAPATTSAAPVAATPAAASALEDITTTAEDEEETKQRKKMMRIKMKEALMMGTGAGEFNIG